MSTDNIDHATHGKESSSLPSARITIDHVKENGIRLQHSPLLDCFFTPEGSSGEYTFHGPKGKELVPHITSGQTFRVELDGGPTLDLQVFFTAHGSWNPVSSDGEDDVEDGGTYTAQAGNGSGLPTGKAASA